MQLRPYQKQFSENLAKAVGKHKQVIACLPTGGGKTKVFISITARAIAKGKTVLIISETRTIFSQITKECNGIEIKAGAPVTFGVLPNKVYIAMAQTLSRRSLITSQFHDLGADLLMIIDEAHIGTATKLLRPFTNALKLGFTATPDWRSGKHLPQLYQHCVVGAQVSDLIQEGFLSPYKHFARVGADMDKLKLKNGEFTEASQEAAFETAGLYAGLIEDLRNLPYKKSLIFCASIKHCKDVQEELEFAGYKSVQVHSQEENSSYNRHLFETGDVNICVSVGVLTKGYDFPAIDLVCIIRCTTSLPLFLQMIGRGARILPVKEHFTCLDYGANYMRFGLWDQDRDWQEMWKEQKKRKKADDKLGVAPVKSCPECEALIPARALVCEFCGYMMEPEAKTPLEGELVEINEAMDKMRGRRISTLSPQELSIFARMQNKKPYSFRIARAHEQQEPGWLEQFRQAMQYKSYWVQMNMPMPGADKIEYHDIVIK